MKPYINIQCKYVNDISSRLFYKASIVTYFICSDNTNQSIFCLLLENGEILYSSKIDNQNTTWKSHPFISSFTSSSILFFYSREGFPFSWITKDNRVFMAKYIGSQNNTSFIVPSSAIRLILIRAGSNGTYQGLTPISVGHNKSGKIIIVQYSESIDVYLT